MNKLGKRSIPRTNNPIAILKSRVILKHWGHSFNTQTSRNSLPIFRSIQQTAISTLVGGLEHEFYLSTYWEFHHPN